MKTFSSLKRVRGEYNRSKKFISTITFTLQFKKKRHFARYRNLFPSQKLTTRFRKKKTYSIRIDTILDIGDLKTFPNDTSSSITPISALSYTITVKIGLNKLPVVHFRRSHRNKEKALGFQRPSGTVPMFSFPSHSSLMINDMANKEKGLKKKGIRKSSVHWRKICTVVYCCVNRTFEILLFGITVEPFPMNFYK